MSRGPEAQLQAQVIELAALQGWLVHAERPAMRADGSWRTAIQGMAGFVDIVLVRGDRLLFCELKSALGRVTPEQQVWHAALRAAGCDVRLWRPADWIEIEAALA